MSSDKFSQEQIDVLGKVEKLLRLAARNPNENEATAASAKAQELIEAYNLGSAAIDIDGETTGKRAEEKLTGGFYVFERDLWRAVAELNFVWYFSVIGLSERRWSLETRDGQTKPKRISQHRLIGKVVNIAATKAMAEYLAETIERLTKERTDGLGVALNSSWAVSFRRGMAERIVEKLEERRQDILNAEEREARSAAKRAREAGIASVETALTLAGVKEKEDEGNYDFLHGKGAWAKKRADEVEWRKRRAEARAETEAQYTAWAAAHPKEAAREEARQLRNQRRRMNYIPRGYASGPAFKGDWAAYRMGRDTGENVSLHRQAEGRKVKGALR